MHESLKKFREIGGHWPGSRAQLIVDGDDIFLVALLRVAAGRDVATSGQNYVSEREFERLWKFAKIARKKAVPRFMRMRFGIHGTRPVSATHKGDLRVGCTLVAYEELLNVARQLWK